MKTRYRLGKEGLFGKPVLILQIFKHFPDGPSNSYGMPDSLAHSKWVDASIEDMSESPILATAPEVK
jgi:hypothetical protein